MRIDVPVEKARAVVNALEAARNQTPVRGTVEHLPAFIRLSDPELQKLQDELLELKFKKRRRQLMELPFQLWPIYL